MIIGGGVGGLTAALAFGRAGHQVTRARARPAAADGRRRGGVRRRAPRRPAGAPDPRLPRPPPGLLRDRFPDVLDALLAAGGSTLPMTRNLGEPQPGDEDLQVIIVRRTTLEWVLRKAALAQPDVEVRTDQAVDRPRGRPAGRRRHARRRRACGSTTAPTVDADVVVASTGRRGDVPGWLGELGVDVPETDPRERADVPHPLVPQPAGRGARRRQARRRPRLREVPRHPRRRRHAVGHPRRAHRRQRAARRPVRPRPLRPGLPAAARARPLLRATARSSRSAACARWPACSTGCARSPTTTARPTVLGFHAVGDCPHQHQPALRPGLLARRGAGRAAGRRRRRAPRRPRRPRRRLRGGLRARDRALVRRVGADGPHGRRPVGHGGLGAAATADAAQGHGRAVRRRRHRPGPRPGPRPPHEPAHAARRPHGRPRRPGPRRRGHGRPRRLPVPPTDGPDPRRAARVASPPSPPPDAHRRAMPDQPTITDAHRRHQRRRPPRRRGRRGLPRRASPTASPSCLLVAPPAARRSPPPATTPSPPTSGATAARAGPRPSRTTTSSTSPTTCSACSTTSARSRRCSSATTGARWSCGRWRCCTPTAWPAWCGMSVPFLPRGPMPPVQLMRQVFGDTFFYILYFQEPGVADADLGRDAGRRRCAACSPASRSPKDGTVDLAGARRARRPRASSTACPSPTGCPTGSARRSSTTTSAEFTRTGFTGGINWYRNFDRNWELTPQLAGAKVTVPSLFIAGSADPVGIMTPGRRSWTAGSRTTAAPYVVDGAGHWVQQETPDEVNAALSRSSTSTRPRRSLTCPPLGPCASARSTPRSTRWGRARRWPSSTTSSGSWRSTASATTRPGSASTTRVATRSSAARRSSSPPPPSGPSTSSSAPAWCRSRTTTRGCVADRIVLLDHLTRGRVIFGAGPGALPTDAHIMGIDPVDQRRMMEESLEAILALFTLRGADHPRDRLVHDPRRPPADAALHATRTPRWRWPRW